MLKTISLPDEQVAWLEKKNISLSKYVQSKLQEDIEKEAKQT